MFCSRWWIIHLSDFEFVWRQEKYSALKYDTLQHAEFREDTWSIHDFKIKDSDAMILLHNKIDRTRFEAEPLGCSEIQLRSKFQTLTVAETEGFRLLRHSRIGCDGLK